MTRDSRRRSAGAWFQGFAFSTGHPLERTLARSRWHGKRFASLHDAKPLICRAEDGSLYGTPVLLRPRARVTNG